jgi:hypothetical protein
VLKLPPEFVILDDVELDEHVRLGPRDPLEDAVERLVAVDQKLGLVARENRHLGQSLACSHPGVLVTQARDERRGFLPDLPDHLRIRLDCVQLTCRHVPVELAPPENQVRRHRHVGKGNERHGPRDRALRCARAHYRVYGEPQAGEVETQRDQTQHGHSSSFAPPAPNAPARK